MVRMSETERKEALKKIIRDLHDGGDVDQLKVRFAEVTGSLSGEQIAAIEQEMIAEGTPVSEVQRLCDVHVDVFREALDKESADETPQGHPVHTFRMENVAIGKASNDLTALIESLGSPPDAKAFSSLEKELLRALDSLAEIEKHYLRKENQLFPFLEAHGIAGPTQVMWGIHDEVRRLMKDVRKGLASSDAASFVEAGTEIANTIREMIYKEEKILFPMALTTLTESEWTAVRQGEGEIGYSLIQPPPEWGPGPAAAETRMPGGTIEDVPMGPGGRIAIQTGALTIEQMNLMFRHIPLDISFVDENDEVRFYSATPERIFPRSPGIIGRKVQNCHPPDSVHVVEEILAALKSGERDVADFWFTMRGMFIQIRYLAIRDESGAYRGTLEISQDVTGIRALEGEQRLLSWK